MMITGSGTNSRNRPNARTRDRWGSRVRFGAFALFSGVAFLTGAAVAADGVTPPPRNPLSGRSAADTVQDWSRSGDPQSSDPVDRGLYLARVGNCIACHSADPEEASTFMAGGKAVPSPFGTFQSTNITPHPTQGIGRWSEADFVRSMREGRSPSGEHYYPAFPYTAYTGMSDRDLSDLYAFLRSIPAVDRPNQPHDLTWFANVGAGLAAWKALNFREWRYEPDRAQSEEWNRGAYLSQAVAHCVECHSFCIRTGRIVANRRYAGAAQGPDGKPTPNITPHASGIAGWTQRHLVRYLEFGMTPDGDFAGGSMAEVIQIGTGHLTPADRRALATYILSLDPIRN